MKIRQLLGLCDHKWIVIEKNQVSAFLPSDRKNSEHVVGFDFIMQCEKCGNLKRKRI